MLCPRAVYSSNTHSQVTIILSGALSKVLGAQYLSSKDVVYLGRRESVVERQNKMEPWALLNTITCIKQHLIHRSSNLYTLLLAQLSYSDCRPGQVSTVLLASQLPAAVVASQVPKGAVGQEQVSHQR